MSHPTTTTPAQPHSIPTKEDATAQPSSTTNTSTNTAQTQATFELLVQLLDYTKGDVDQAEKLAQLVARLSPGSPLSLLTQSGYPGGAPSTQTSVSANTAAAAAASVTGVAVSLPLLQNYMGFSRLDTHI